MIYLFLVIKFCWQEILCLKCNLLVRLIPTWFWIRQVICCLAWLNNNVQNWLGLHVKHLAGDFCSVNYKF